MQSLRRYMRHHIWFLRSKLTPTICGPLSGDLELLEEFSFPYVPIRLGTSKVRILLLSHLSPVSFDLINVSSIQVSQYLRS